MFNKYKELEYRINDLQKANDKFKLDLKTGKTIDFVQ